MASNLLGLGAGLGDAVQTYQATEQGFNQLEAQKRKAEADKMALEQEKDLNKVLPESIIDQQFSDSPETGKAFKRYITPYKTEYAPGQFGYKKRDYMAFQEKHLKDLGFNRDIGLAGAEDFQNKANNMFTQKKSLEDKYVDLASRLAAVQKGMEADPDNVTADDKASVEKYTKDIKKIKEDYGAINEQYTRTQKHAQLLRNEALGIKTDNATTVDEQVALALKVKADPNSTPEQIAAADQIIEKAQAYVSGTKAPKNLQIRTLDLPDPKGNSHPGGTDWSVENDGTLKYVGPAQEKKPLVTVDTGGKLSVEAGKEGLKDLSKGREAADMAVTKYNMVKNQIALLDTGKAGGPINALKAYLAPGFSALGVDVSGMNEAQLYEAWAKAIGGSNRMAVIGPGQVSDYEQKIMQRLSGSGSKMTADAAKGLLKEYLRQQEDVISRYNNKVDSFNKTYIKDNVQSPYEKVELEKYSEPLPKGIPKDSKKITGRVGPRGNPVWSTPDGKLLEE